MGNAYDLTVWQDHVTEYDDRYIETENGDGTVTHTPVEGGVIQQGTPQSAQHFNNMECGIFAATETAAALLVNQMAHERRLDNAENDIDALQNDVAQLKGEAGTVTLQNSQAYPFNNSKTTISLITERETTDYCVHIDVITASGSVGDIVVSDKQVNGFKVEFTGSATSVQLRYIITGGCEDG